MVATIIFNANILWFELVLDYKSDSLPRDNQHCITNILIRNPGFYIFTHRDSYAPFVDRLVFLHYPTNTRSEHSTRTRWLELAEFIFYYTPTFVCKHGV